ncbi:hypothetical protein GJ496_000190 [Pomphorhynchus laevis]|nr:hypothetical protein GJ496_000190 [Pomphorhynchus laevis]
MQKGDTKAAIKSLEDASGGSYLNPDDFIGSSTVRQLLESKYPEGDRVYVEGVMTCPHPNLLPFHPVIGGMGILKSLRAGNPGMELV